MKLRVYRKRHGRRVNGRYRVYWPGSWFIGTARELRRFADRLWYLPDDPATASTSPDVPPIEPEIPAGVNPDDVPADVPIDDVPPLYSDPVTPPDDADSGNHSGDTEQGTHDEVVQAVLDSEISVAVPLVNELTTRQLEVLVDVAVRPPVIEKAKVRLGL